MSLTTFISQDVKWKGLARRSKYLFTENYRLQMKKSKKINLIYGHHRSISVNNNCAKNVYTQVYTLKIKQLQ